MTMIALPKSRCRFHPRCRYATEICSQVEPPLTDYGNGHLQACLLDDETKEREAAKLLAGTMAEAS